MTGADILSLVKKYTEPMRRRIGGMIGRCVIEVIYDSTANALQAAQITITADEVKDKIERLQDYGFTSNPKPGAEGLVLFHSGERTHGILIKVDDRRYRLVNLASGEVALYTDEGDYIWFKRNRKLHLRSNNFTFQGNADELMDLLRQLSQQCENMADTLSTTTVNTVFGPMKLNDFSTFATIKSSVDTIRTKIIALTG